MDIEEGWKRLVASRPLGPQILVYGDPLVVAGRHGGGFFCFLCFLQKRTGGYPAGRARVPTTQPSTPGSPHELGRWLGGPGDGRRRRFHGGGGIDALGRNFNSAGNFVNIAATTKLMALLYLQLGLKKPLRYFIWSDSTSYTSYGR